MKKRYDVQSIVAVDKLTAFYTQASGRDKVAKTVMPDNLIWRNTLEQLSEDIDGYRCTSGYFSEYHASSVSELAKIINRRYQTLAYYGLPKEELAAFIREVRPSGIDRIVPIGQTTDFSLVWDGYDLIELLSREI